MHKSNPVFASLAKQSLFAYQSLIDRCVASLFAMKDLCRLFMTKLL